MRRRDWDHTPRTRRTASGRRKAQREQRYRKFKASDVSDGRLDEVQLARQLIERKKLYEVAPPIPVHRDAAYKGVYWRLVGASLCGAVASGALASLLLLGLSGFVFLIVATVAGGFALVAITLSMSARKEEEVHQLAATLWQKAREERLLEDKRMPDTMRTLSCTDGDV